MFHLSFPIPESNAKISIEDSIVPIGSCFAGNIGDRLSEYKFNVLSNPFGTIYNPISIAEILTDQIDDSAVVQNQGIFYNWHSHSRISALEEAELKQAINQKRQELQKQLSQANWVIITLGSAFAYRLNSTGKLVANCHKVAQSEFTKEMLSIDQMQEVLDLAMKQLKRQNPSLNILFTISPVRHFRDGLVENSQSKARLLEVVHALVESHGFAYYFPAYEIQIDELRDYRFYAQDRVHPNEEAIDYIWQKFQETFFDETTQTFVKDWRQIKASINHRPIHPHSSEHQAFIQKTIGKLEELSNQVDVSEEVSLLKKQLI